MRPDVPLRRRANLVSSDPLSRAASPAVSSDHERALRERSLRERSLRERSLRLLPPPARARRTSSWLILAVFLLSGAAGLVYEVVWSRQLVLVFGNTAEATSAILTGFFAGMALGAFAGGRLADRVRSPLRLYGLLELGTVVAVLATPVLFRLVAGIYGLAFGALETNTGLLVFARFGLALLALGPATVLMGATLPALTRHLRSSGTLADAFGRLYAVNTIGAIGGTLAAGGVLIELLGLSGTLIAGCACSTLAGVTALLLSRHEPAAQPKAGPGTVVPAALADEPPGGTLVAQPAPARQPGSGPGQGDQPRPQPRLERPATDVTPSTGFAQAPRLALALAFISGVTSLGYQVLWNRMLGEGTGGDTYVFTLILATFLVGLAIGATAFALVRPHVRDITGLIAVTQAGVAILSVAGLVLLIEHPPVLPLVADQVDRMLGILARHTILVVLPTTVLLGFSFPAASALLADRPDETATETGGLIALNTVGSIAGTFLVPFALVPLVGSAGTLVLLASVNALVALSLGIARSRRLVSARFATIGGAIAAVAVVIAVVSGSIVSPSVALARERGGTVFAAREDQVASVVAGEIGSRKQLWVGGTDMTALTVDTKLMPVLAVALRPQAARALVIAFGMGSAYRDSLLEGMRTDAVELVPSVPLMFRYFYPDAARILADPKGRIIIDDGRNYLDLTHATYDTIMVDPPPPIQTAGVSVIASLEFYRAGAAHLRPGGTMMEWVPYGATVPEFHAIVRTFASVFAHVLIVRGPGGHGFFMFGSADPLDLTQAGLLSALRRPGIAADLSSTSDAPVKGASAWAAYLPSQVWLNDAQVMRYAGTGPLVTDDHPLPEYFLLRHTFDPAPYLTSALPPAVGTP